MRRVRAVIKWLVPALGALIIIWLGLAWTSGAFLPRDAWAVAPGELTEDGFSHQKRTIELNGRQVAYIESGEGPPLILLHGCPFSAFEWRAIIPALARHHRVIAPDLIGLGDTPVRLNQDYRLPQEADMVRELMHHLDIERANFVAHDHGGATVLLLMNSHPDLLGRVVLTNIEAYDQWPSQPELPYLRGIVNSATSQILFHAFHMDWLQREGFGVAFLEPQRVDRATYRAFIAPHISTPARWQRLRRFFEWQLDPAHNRLMLDALPGMRAFDRPVLLLWGANDENFGPAIARRLAHDVPGVVGARWMRRSAHMPMLEEPDAYAASVLSFLADQPLERQGPDFEPAAALRAKPAEQLDK